MPRYVVMAPRAEYWSDREMPSLPHPIAYESGPVDTGLKDSEGRPIYRMPDQIGFLRDNQS